MDVDDETRARNFAHFLYCTSAIQYPAGARAAIKNLADLLTRWQSMTPADLWAYYLKAIPQSLVAEWHTAYSDAQNLFDPDPVEMPLSALSDEDRKRAETPGDPLI